jgi:ubiquinone/menaquinone biosynthesis C-methylase UbiE
MADTNHRATQRQYDRLSSIYDLISGRSEGIPRSTGLAKLRINSGECVLEIGAGTGTALQELIRSTAPGGKVFGIDLSTGMLKRTRQRLTRADGTRPANLCCGDACWLPFLTSSLEAIFMSFTLELFSPSEIPLVLKECRRILTPAGRIGVVSLSGVGPDTWMRRAYEWSHRRFPTWVDCRPILVKEALSGAGFHIHDSTCQSMCGLPVEIVIAQRKKD